LNVFHSPVFNSGGEAPGREDIVYYLTFCFPMAKEKFATVYVL
jgi:hypothetical protein